MVFSRTRMKIPSSVKCQLLDTDSSPSVIGQPDRGREESWFRTLANTHPDVSDHLASQTLVRLSINQTLTFCWYAFHKSGPSVTHAQPTQMPNPGDNHIDSFMVDMTSYLKEQMN